MSAPWLNAEELRIGLGTMRLTTAEGADEERALAVLEAAISAGLTVFDTAHAYQRVGGLPGDSERLLSRAIRASGRGPTLRVVTKGGMRREGTAWIPDGRSSAIDADADASLEALGGLNIDLYLLHAPDPKVPWTTSVRALARVLESGRARRIGVCNVSRRLLDEALELAPIAAVQVALGASHDEPIRGGVVARCVELGIPLLAHSPLGGPDRAPSVRKDRLLQAVSRRTGATPEEVLLAGVRQLAPEIIPLPGPTRVETVASIARAARLTLSGSDLAELSARKPFSVALRSAPVAESLREGEVVLIAGLQGAGKTDRVEEWVRRGYLRLNRDERGGTLQQLARALDQELSAGTTRVVLDNTYASRASRRSAIDVAARHGLPVRAVWLEVPLAQAQINVVLRMLAAHGRLLNPEEMTRREDPTALPPNGQFRTSRELEPPAADEGFSVIDRLSFERRQPLFGSGVPSVLVAFDALVSPSGALRPEPLAGLHGRTVAVFAWRPGASEPLTGVLARLDWPPGIRWVGAECVHPAGPPRCWCRPPLPGLPLALAREHRLSFAGGELIGTGPAHASLAAALGLSYVAAG